VVTVGFCFGGSHSWRLAGSDLDSGPDVAASVGFYGQARDDRGRARRPPDAHGIAGADARDPG
jgi:carboxymethylenebutenolidase